MKPAIVIPAYNRPQALHRLLASLAKAEYPAGVPLVISIDPGGQNEAAVRQAAEQFNWPFGVKEIIRHESHLGLTGNVFFCGDLSDKFGAVVLLEDDLFVSPAFYAFAAQAVPFFADDERVAAVSLNALWFNGYTHHAFTPYLDESDLFFMQVAWFQGQAYTRDQWARFRTWQENEGSRTLPPGSMHQMFQRFPPTDWFPLMTRYLVENGRYYAFPRQSLTTNFGEEGTHFSKATQFFQVPLQTRQMAYRLVSLDDATAVYDSFQEMVPERLNRLNRSLLEYEYAVDLNGSRDPESITAEYVLTTKASRHRLFSYGKVMRPLEANVAENIPGDGIVFCRTEDLISRPLARLRMERSNEMYFTRRPISWRRRILYACLGLLERLYRN